MQSEDVEYNGGRLARRISWQSEAGEYNLKRWMTERLRFREAFAQTSRVPISIQDLTKEILDYFYAMPFLVQEEYLTIPTQQDMSSVLYKHPAIFQEVTWPGEPQQWLLTDDFCYSRDLHYEDIIPRSNFWNESLNHEILADANRWYLSRHQGPMRFIDLVNVVQRRLWIQPLVLINEHPLVPTEQQIKAALLTNEWGVFHKVQDEPEKWEVLTWL